MTTKRAVRLAVVVVAALVVAYVEYHGQSERPIPAGEPAPSSVELGNISVTKHGRCRMECRHIDMGEVREVIAQGNVNRRKSDPGAKPCPINAFEGRTSDGQLARIVVAECADTRKIVTVIDLERKYRCICD